jgi:hypothetical protein
VPFVSTPVSEPSIHILAPVGDDVNDALPRNDTLETVVVVPAVILKAVDDVSAYPAYFNI